MEVITYGNVDLLASILQGVAYIFFDSPTADFAGMMGVVGVIGFMAALVAYAFAPQKLIGWKWLITVVCVSAALTIPKTDVQVIDRLQGCTTGACVKLVPNVPLALAALASVTSKIGDKLTELYETTFQNVVIRGAAGQAGFSALWNNASFRGNGMMFGNKLVRNAARVSFPDANFRFDMIKFIENCAMPDMSDGTLDPSVVRESPDIWATISADPNPARYSPTHGGAVLSCTDLVASLDARVPAQANAAKTMLARSLISDRANTNDGTGMGTTMDPDLDAQLQSAYQRTALADGAMSATDLIRQNAMINILADSNGVYSQRTGDPSAVMLGLAESQAKISTNSSWITSAKIAEEAMPMIRNGIEAILYAAFPIVVLILLMTTGETTAKLIKSYAGALLWIQMWPPLYAVLNHMAVVASSNHVASAGALPGGKTGLALLSASAIYENTISDMAVVGYLTISIPVIAWSLIKGMDSIASGALAGAGAFSAGSGAGAASAASGNVSLGNVGMDQVNLAPSYRSANFSTHDDGNWKTTTMAGESSPRYGVANKSDLGDVGAKYAMNQALGLKKSAEESFGRADKEDEALKSTLTSTFTEAGSMLESEAKDAVKSQDHQHGSVGKLGSGSGSDTGKQNGAGDLTSGGDDQSVTDSHMTRDTVEPFAENLLRGGGEGSGGGDKYNDTLVGNDKVGKAYQSRKDVTERMSKAQTAKEAQDIWDEYKKSDDYKTSHGTFKKSDDRIDSGLTEANTHEKSKTAALEEGRRFKSEADYVSSHSTEIGASLGSAIFVELAKGGSAALQGFSNDMRERPNDAMATAAALAAPHIDNITAGMGGGVGPNGNRIAPSDRAMRDLPPGIDDDVKDDVRREQAGAAGALRGDEAVREQKAANDARLRAGRAAGGMAPKPGNAHVSDGGLKDEVRSGQGQIQGMVQADQARLNQGFQDKDADVRGKLNDDKALTDRNFSEAQEGTQLRRDIAKNLKDRTSLDETVEDAVQGARDALRDLSKPD